MRIIVRVLKYRSEGFSTIIGIYMDDVSMMKMPNLDAQTKEEEYPFSSKMLGLS